MGDVFQQALERFRVPGRRVQASILHFQHMVGVPPDAMVVADDEHRATIDTCGGLEDFDHALS